ncbi:gliding motility lipoprotein GldD [Hymenobacter taeanensis]|uniref:Gliding motility lipoprotein GldD n=1 Tax=Hymenobacter taeanensis TaxID=2735321 RepID=A0A6M6BGP2_9BACT|nr:MULTISPECIES: gliding motility lipoprotein GldD [Hymenobacter]QJX47172.1 gliding motility lipoprotein GldD [Hymenobacter taeanensis]UOQ81089.1 gliding motility lipoprotein GldD [Hymenobacter sp. 5414T-23]
MADFRILRGWGAVLTLLGLAASCTSAPDFTPKPKGYNRIDLPPHAYQQLAPGHPYTFQYSRYAKILRDSSYLAQPHWINVYYPQLHANVQITYANLQRNKQLSNKLLEDARKLTSKHQIKATAIDESVLKTPNGMRVAVFELQGDVPSQFQFYTTDSTKNFFRGALYFRTATANDSLAPVIDYVKKDIVQLLNTLKYQ